MKTNNEKSNWILVVFGILIVFALINKSNIDFVKATTTYVGGWGWGGTTSTDGAYKGIGWLSFSNTADGSIIDYGVNVPAIPSTGTLPITGNAWSELYGWLSFNSADVTDCPSATGANIDSTGKLKGWARFLSIKTAAAAGNSGGWLGCVSLSSTNMGDSIQYGATTTGSGIFGGYAWSDELGWIDFSRVGLNKMVNISPNDDTIMIGDSVTFSSTANFADGSMVGHNISWKNHSSNCWNWEVGCVTNDASTIINSTTTFSNTSTHALSNVVFMPANIGIYDLYASATSSLSTEPFWVSSPIATLTVLSADSCDFFGDLVDIDSTVTTYTKATAPDCNLPTIKFSSTCQSGGTFNPALKTYKVCSTKSTTPKPKSVSVSSATIHPGDSIAVTWDIENPDSTCHIQATSTDPLAIDDTANLNRIFESFTTPLVRVPVLTSLTDLNDPYSTSTQRTIKNAIQTNYDATVSTHARGQKTVILNYPTSFTAYCGIAPGQPGYVPIEAKKIRINVTKNVEG